MSHARHEAVHTPLNHQDALMPFYAAL